MNLHSDDAAVAVELQGRTIRDARSETIAEDFALSDVYLQPLYVERLPVEPDERERAAGNAAEVASRPVANIQPRLWLSSLA